MFSVKTTEIEIEGEKYELKPLTGKYLPQIYSIVQKMQEANPDGKEDANTLAAFDKQTVEDLHEVCLETMKKSYPSQDTKELEDWVSQNMLLLIEGVFTVNLGSQK